MLLPRYTNTQIYERLCEAFFVHCCSFVYPFYEKGVFAVRIRRYTLQNDHFLFGYSFLFVAQIKPPPGTSIRLVLGAVQIRRCQKIANMLLPVANLDPHVEQHPLE